MKNHQHINQDSGQTEYYTPQAIIEAARLTMGGIDLDPASSEKANERVKSASWYGLPVNGLQMPWVGRVWLNHPFSKSHNAAWIQKLIAEFKSGRCTAFCCITFASTSERWFRPLLDFPQCFLIPRTNYLLPDGTVKRGVTKGSVVTFGGPTFAAHQFAANFKQLGVTKI